MIEHPIAPVYNEKSRILILGSFPSVRSREVGFFYGHPQNRFWPLMAALFDEKPFADIPAKRAFLLAHGIALWDSARRCEIRGSSDASLREIEPTDLSPLFAAAPIGQVFCNGRASFEIYRKFQEPRFGPAILLPSTSPANAAWSLPRLEEAWKVVREALV